MDIENKKNQEGPAPRERVLLAGVDDGSARENFERSMEELKNLAEACLMEPAGVITQRMQCADRALYMGAGKVQELKEAAEYLEADLIIFDDTLTPSQLRNLQRELKKPVMDRTALILNIFKARARTREAKLQVESARLKYLLPRLTGMHAALTRQGGTSGSMSSRGAGEKKLELDRRRIEQRITELNRDLKEVSRERQVQRRLRQNARIPLAALVGYTNAGKSAIMNAMIDAYVKDEKKKVLEKDMLFATLDTTVRRICTGNNRDFLLSDTVGFIHKLPHGLVKAFRSTLEEVGSADLLVIVVDYSDPYYREHKKTIAQMLLKTNAAGIPSITVYNKADRCENDTPYPRAAGDDCICICAKDERSVQLLADHIADKLYEDYVPAEFLIPYKMGQTASYFMENAQVVRREFEAGGTRLIVRCHKADRDKYAEFMI